MIWTDWPPMYCEVDPPRCEPLDYRRETADGREQLLTIRRLALAKAEASALKARLDEERLVADTAIRALHLRLDGCEPFVRLATGLTFHPPGSLAHSQHLLELAAMVEERRRHQRAPDAQGRTAP